MSTIRNRVLAALPLAITLCSLELRLAFACGECPTGAPLGSVPSTIVSAIGSGQLSPKPNEKAPQGGSFIWWD